MAKKRKYMIPVHEPNLASAPSVLLSYGSKFLNFEDVIRCREVCKHWQEVIDNKEYDHMIFSRFSEGQAIGDFRPYFTAAKDRYINRIADLPRPYQQMNDHHVAPPPHNGAKQNCIHCCNCTVEVIKMIGMCLLGCATCCGCCGCCCCCCGQLLK
jgi:hypothetical protein